MNYLYELLTKPHYEWTILDSLTALAAFAFLLLAVERARPGWGRERAAAPGSEGVRANSEPP